MNYRNVRVSDVAGCFAAVNDQGVLKRFSGGPVVLPQGSHIQGVAKYADYLLVAHNNLGASTGFVCVLSLPLGKYLYSFDTPTNHFNHPGGIQRIGDVLAVSVETSDHKASYVCFYDLTVMSDSQPPALLDGTVQIPSRGTGAVGITDFGEGSAQQMLLVAYDNGSFQFFQADLSDAWPPSFAPLGPPSQVAANGYSSVCLATETSGRIFMVGFSTENLGGSNDDYADLYEVTLPTTDQPATFNLISSRHLHSTHPLAPGLFGVHCRWGAVLQISQAGEFSFWLTDRNFNGFGLETNLFSPSLSA